MARRRNHDDRDGGWLSTAGEYQDLISDLTTADPRLRQRDPGARGNPLPTNHANITVFETNPNGIFDEGTEYSDARSFEASLVAEPSSRDPDGRRVYILEGLDREFISILGSFFLIHPSFFVEHERVVVFSTWPSGESDTFLLPASATSRQHITLKYFELVCLPPFLHDKFALECAVTGRHIGVTRFLEPNRQETKFSPYGIIRRKCSIWTGKREGGTGWDCISPWP